MYKVLKCLVSSVMLFLALAEEVPRRCVLTGNATNDSICVPVCCGPDKTYKYNMTSGTYKCEGVKSKNYFWDVYDSNVTHIDTNSTMQNVSVYHQPLSCPKWRYLLSPESEFSLGFIWNSSFILVDVDQRQISLVPPSNYCIEFREMLKSDATNDHLVGPIFAVCGEGKVKSSTVKAGLYLGLLIISTVSYFVSAGCYLFFLKVKDIHRKCFVAYSISMGLTFLFLVLLQQWQAKCFTLGFFFFLFIMNGFLWLTILCVDLALELWYFERTVAKDRWYWYLGACLTVPPFILFASVIPDWVPDIPDTFIINFGSDIESMCTFKESTNYFFFLPIGIMMAVSLAALCAAVHAIRVNNKNFSNHFPWLDSRGSYKYIFRSCLLMWIFSTVWMVESGVRLKFPGVQKLALFLIESSLGIFTMLVFVFNRYTRKEMMQKFHRKNRKESPIEMITNLLEVKENKSCGNCASER